MQPEQAPRVARIMITDWHSILALLIALWSVVYPFLDPAHFQLLNALDSLAVALIAIIYAHGHASQKQHAIILESSIAGPPTGVVPTPPRSSHGYRETDRD